MPKVVDVEERRLAIAEAVWRVASRDGLAAASVRTVAEEAGVSPGALRHYFASQDDLYRCAMVMIDQAVRAEIDRLAARYATAADDDGTLVSIDAALELLLLLVPADDADRVYTRLWLDFAALAQTNSGLQPILRESHDAIREACIVALRLAGRIVDDESVGALHALVDGLALHGTLQPDLMPPDHARRLLERELDRAPDVHPTESNGD